MELLMNPLKFAVLDLGVDLSGLDAGMSKHFLNES
jgi:hypothetical protein